MKQFLILCLSLFFITISISQTRDRPNIILVLADDLGFGDVSINNPDKSAFSTPEMDKIAKDGINFSDAHTSSSVCTPTRYGILTGRYNWRSKLKSGVVYGTTKALIEIGRSTIASLLKKKNYQTAFIGKWHLGWDWKKFKRGEKVPEGIKTVSNIDFSKPITHSPSDLGFDYFFGHCGSLDMAPYVYVENNQPTSVPTKYTEGEGGYRAHRKGPIADDFIMEEVNPNIFERGIEYVKTASKENKPYFLYLPLPSPHTPIMPTEEFQGKSGINPYADFVLMIDHYMGLIHKAVKESGEEENTMIIFTSDNGCSPTAKFSVLEKNGHFANYIFRGKKSDIYDGGHRVPFFVKWPAGIKPNQTTDQTICTTDFMATFADIVGYQLADNEGEDSYSLLPLFEGKSFENNSFREATIHHSIQGKFAIRKGKWKLLFCQGSGGWTSPSYKEFQEDIPKFQLFDMEKDPSETTNVYEQNKDTAENLRKLLVKYILDGRSTKGDVQRNYIRRGLESWKSLSIFMTEKEITALDSK